MQKSLVVKNIDFDLLYEQMMQLAEVSKRMLQGSGHFLPEEERAVAGASQFFERLCNLDTEQKTLQDPEVESITAELESLAFYFENRSSFAHQSEKLALKRVITFLRQQPFPIKP